MTFETTTLYLPQDFTAHDLEFVDGKATKDKTGSIVSEQIDKSAQRDASKVKENPYWFEDWVVKDTEPHYHPENAHHHHHHHNTRRAKRNHYRKLKTIQSGGGSSSHSEHHETPRRHLTKRSIDYQDDEIFMPDEVFAPSEVIENIFNANDTIRYSGLTGSSSIGSPGALQSSNNKDDGKFYFYFYFISLLLLLASNPFLTFPLFFLSSYKFISSSPSLLFSFFFSLPTNSQQIDTHTYLLFYKPSHFPSLESIFSFIHLLLTHLRSLTSLIHIL